MTSPPYHLDWIGTIISLIGLWLIGKKRWEGWLANIILNSTIYPFLNIRFHLYGFLIQNATFLVISTISAVRWFKEKKALSPIV